LDSATASAKLEVRGKQLLGPLFGQPLEDGEFAV